MVHTDAAAKSDGHVVAMPHRGEIVIGNDYGFIPKRFFWRLAAAALRIVVMPLIMLYNKLILGVRVKGRENIRLARRAGRGVITVSNHINVMDCAMTAQVCFPRAVGLTTIQDNLTIPVAGKLVKLLGGIPIPKEPARMRHFVKFVGGRLKRNKIIHFYPEGILRPYSGRLHAFSRGAFVLSVKNGSPIVPVVYVQRRLGGLMRLYRKGKCSFTAMVLPPEYPDQTLPVREAAAALMSKVFGAMALTLRDCCEKVVDVRYP